MRTFNKGLKGLKRARIKSGFKTQQALTDALLKAKFNVTLDTVQNWEQGKSSPSMETLLKLCDFFGCSADYLLGRIEEKNHDLAFICEYTGLSEESITNLDKLNVTTLNYVLLSSHFKKILDMISNSAEYANGRGNVIASYIQGKLNSNEKITALLEPIMKAGGDYDMIFRTNVIHESGILFDEISSTLYDQTL